MSNQASAMSVSSESEGSDDEDFFKPKGQADKVCPFFHHLISVKNNCICYLYEDLQDYFLGEVPYSEMDNTECMLFSVLYNTVQGTDHISSSDDINAEDCSKFSKSEIKDWYDQDLIESIRDRFVTGDWSKAAKRGQATNENGEEGDDEGPYDYIEDLETGEVYNGRADTDKHEADQSGADAEAEERRRKKLALRAKFDAEYPFLYPLGFSVQWF
jgi:hypothetical protein